MHDIDVVPGPHHDVYPGRPGNSRQSKRVPADANGRRVHDRAAARPAEQRDLVDRHVLVEQFEIVDIAERVISHPPKVLHRHLFLAQVLGGRLGRRPVHAHEVDEDVLVRRRHPKRRGVYRPQHRLSKPGKLRFCQRFHLKFQLLRKQTRQTHRRGNPCGCPSPAPSYIHLLAWSSQSHRHSRDSRNPFRSAPAPRPQPTPFLPLPRRPAFPCVPSTPSADPSECHPSAHTARTP